MTKAELLLLLLGQAKCNGFSLRRWYTRSLGRPWVSAQEAAETLLVERRYYGLFFCHEFAQAFWKPGAPLTFEVPNSVFKRTMPDGSVRTVTRRPYTRRSNRADAWRYHLKELALAEEPLRYMRRYLRVEEDLDPETLPGHAAGRSTGGKADVGKTAGGQTPGGQTAGGKTAVARPKPPSGTRKPAASVSVREGKPQPGFVGAAVLAR